MSEDVATDFASAFWAAKHALALASSAAFADHGVHEGQQFVLRCLWREDGLTPGDVARQLGLATSTVTRTAKRLEAAGLLTREPHSGDGRLVRLVLTSKGHELETMIGAEMRRLDAMALLDFSPDEQAAMIGALERVRRNLASNRRAGA